MAITQDAAAGIMSHQILSLIDLKPEHLTQLFRMNNAGLESKTYMYSHILGFEAPVANTTYKHTEKGLSNASLTVALKDNSGLTAGDPATFTLTGDSATYVYVRANDIVQFKTGEQGIVSSVNSTAKTFVVTPPSTVTLPSTTADEYLVISTRAFGEGAVVGDPAYTRSTQYTHRTQIIKEKVSTSGTALTDMTWVEYGPEGYFSLQTMDGQLRMLRRIEGMFLHGKESTDMPDPATGSIDGVAPTAGGLIDTASTNGVQGLNTPSAPVDFDVYSQSNMANFVSTATPIHVMLGIKAQQGINMGFIGSSSVLVDSTNFLAKATDDSLFKQSEAYGAYMNFKYYNNQYTYQFDVNESWSDPTGFGATGYDYDNSALFVPIYKVKDGMSGKMFGTMGTRYKSHNGVNRKFMIDTHEGFGTVNGKTISEYDTKSVVYLSDMGTQFMGTHQYIFATPA